MILPSKHLRQDRALLAVGANILAQLDEPHTVSELWERTRKASSSDAARHDLSFDWFVLALCLLFAVSAIDQVDNIIVRQDK